MSEWRKRDANEGNSSLEPRGIEGMATSFVQVAMACLTQPFSHTRLMNRLIKLEERYGPDFLKKLPMYKTASLNGKYVRLCEVDTNIMQALVKGEDGKHINVSVWDLDNFVL